MAVAATVLARDEVERGMDEGVDWIQGGRGRWVKKEMEKDVNSYGAPVATDEILKKCKEK